MANVTLDKSWFRPALIAFTDTMPTASVASVGAWNISGTAGTDYIFLTDDNRSALQVSVERIEFRKRMINGRMRTYHVVDKKSFSFSYSELPSTNTQVSEYKHANNAAWAGGKKMLEWYEGHPDSFYVLLVYDTPNPEGSGNIPLKYKVETYNVFFDSFDFSIVRRGTLFDHWEVSMSLVEV